MFRFPEGAKTASLSSPNDLVCFGIMPGKIRSERVPRNSSKDIGREVEL